MVVFDFKYSDVEGLTRLDAEYYNPVYINKVKLVRNINSKKVGELFKIELGPAFSSRKIGTEDGIPISKIGDVTNKRKVSSWDFLDEKEFSKYGNRNIRQNEILMTLTGDPPDVGKVNMPFTEFDDKESILAFNQRVAKLEAKDIDPYYLFAALSSEYFRIRFEQCAFGIRQRNVSIPDLKSAYVFIADDIQIEEVSSLVKEHFRLKTQSQSLYQQATTLLEKELGLDKLTFEKPKSYTASFSEILDFSRIDGEHFQPKFRKIREVIENYQNGFERLISNIKVVKPDYQLKNHPTNSIQYIELSDINPSMGYIDRIEEMDIKNAPSRAKRMAFTGDVIASSVVGSVDKAGLVSENENGHIASNGFFQFRSDYYSPEFLLLLIKSNFVKQQFYQQSTGGILSGVPDQNLKYIIIPKIDIALQNQITELVKESHIKVRESKLLLEQAKSRVEELIETVEKF